jgi:hypothetical protein
MTRPPITTSQGPLKLDARAQRFAKLAAECSAGIFPGDYSETAISAFAAEMAELFAKWDAEDAQRKKAERKPRQPRRPNIKQMIEGAEKANKPLASITMPDGTKLDFDKPGEGEAEKNLKDLL